MVAACLVLDTGIISTTDSGACVQAGWVSLVHRRCDMSIICVMLSVDMEAIKLGYRLNVLGFDF